MDGTNYSDHDLKQTNGRTAYAYNLRKINPNPCLYPYQVKVLAGRGSCGGLANSSKLRRRLIGAFHLQRSWGNWRSRVMRGCWESVSESQVGMSRIWREIHPRPLPLEGTQPTGGRTTRGGKWRASSASTSEL